MKSKLLIKTLLMVTRYFVYAFIVSFLLANVAFASVTKAQKVKNIRESYINMEFKDASLMDVFARIETATDYDFTYFRSDLDNNYRFNYSANNQPVSNVLMQISKETGLKFKQINSNINVGKKLPVEVIVGGDKQGINVKGTVKDGQGNPLPGVNVVEVGTSTGTITDLDGNYSITVSSEDALLRFSFVGYLTEEIEVAGQTNLDITLIEDIQALDEVVVIGYGTVKKSDLTGSVASVEAEDLQRVPVGSVDQALQGRAPGVSVIQRNGEPGNGSIIRIRGANSIQGGNDPLVILDGFPITGSIGTINLNEIENIEILKDASATSIYGARATNGVVIITTKRGKVGQSNIDFNMYYGWQQPVKKIDLMNAQQFMEIANELAANDGDDPYFPNPDQVEYDTDWQDEIYRVAPIQNYNLAFNGGTEVFRFNISGDYFNQDGIMYGSDYERGTLRANLEGDLNNWLTISNSLLLARSGKNNQSDAGAENNPSTGALMAPPTLPVKDEDGNWNHVNTYGFSPGALNNPVAPTRDPNRLDKQLGTRIFDNFYATIQFTDWLSFKSSFGIDYSTGRSDGYTPRTLQGGLPAGRAYKSNYENYSLLNENTINFDYTLNDHSINAFAGYTWQKYETTNFSVSTNGFVTDDLLNNVLGAGSEPQPPSSGLSDWGIASWLGRVNYAFMDKYLVTVSGRADGSSRFSDDNKWAFFPSVAVAWRISEEAFMQNQNIVSGLKLRASYGQTGNQAVSPYQTWTKMVATDLSLGDQLHIGYIPGNIANKELKWETTSQYDIGIDIGVLEGRIRIVADYFRKNTFDLLARVDLPSSSGYSSSTQNIGEMKNQGFEIELDAALLTGTFKWNSGVNFWKTENEIVKLAKGADVFAPKVDNLIPSVHILREGYPISMFYGFIKDGYTEDGITKYKDLNGDGVVDDMDRDFIGNPHPDFQFGWNNHFSWKGFDLSIFLEGAYGFDIFNATREFVASSFYKGGNQIVEVYNDHWTPENRDAKYSKITAKQSFRQSDAWIEDGSYIKIRSITIGYDLPSDLINWGRSARVYVSMQNWFTFTDYSWYDPEVSTYSSGDLRLGVDKGTYPKAKTISIGFNLGL